MSKSKEGMANQSVFSYLLKQNRPYSATDLFMNMGKDLGKTAVVKALEGLAAEGKIREKVYGKQKVYVIDQSHFPEVDESGVKSMDEQISQLNGRVQLKGEEVRKLESEVKTFDGMISTAAAQEEVSRLQSEIEKMREKLEKLQKGTVLISKEEKEKVYKGRETYVKAWRKRKRISSDILNAILEGYPKSKKQLYEEVGIETDEDYNVSPPEI